MKNERLRKWMGLVVPSLIIYMVLDFINLPSRMGVAIDNLNIDLMSLVVNTLVVIVLYAITFVEIDSEQKERAKNSRKTGELLLRDTYKQCLTTLNLIADDALLRKFIIPKIDFNVLENKVENSLKDSPFVNNDEILHLAAEGHITPNQLNMYFETRKEYRDVISLSITFFDRENMVTPEQQQLGKVIEEKKKELFAKLNKLIVE